jgi:MinD-like ATPase involved in chromosome partitioning or flagellar assembly
MPGRYGSWVVAVASGSGGTGVTSTALALGLTLARGRDDARVALLDAQSGGGSLGLRAAGEAAPSRAAMVRDPWDAEPLRLPDGLRVVDGGAGADADAAGELDDALAVLSAKHSTIVLDLGDERSAAGRFALAVADAIVLVTTVRPAAIDGLSMAAAGVAAMRAGAGTPVVIAVTALAGEAVRPLAERLAAAPGPHWPTVVIPHDQVLAGPGLIRLADLDPATVDALTGLADVVSEG